MKQVKRDAGFTLIELLVAVSLLALVSVLGYRGLDGMLRGRDGLDKRTQELAALNETWRWLARDLTHLIPALPATDGVSPIQTSSDDAGNTIVTMTVFNELRDAPDAEQARYRLVTYQIVASGLQRSERPLRTATEITENQTIILAPASRWKIAYWNPGGNWVNPPNGSSTGAPSAVQVSLTLFDQPFIRIFNLTQ